MDRMLTIGKIDREAARTYYIKYADEANPGIWVGSAVEQLGFSEGQVADQTIVASLLAGGRVTAEAISLARQQNVPLPKLPTMPVRHDHRAGFDLTFSAPKTVSVLAAAIENPDKKRLVIQAHDDAVRLAVHFVEQEAGRVRLHHIGVPAEMVGVAYRHWTSRSNDPQLHTHVLIPNLGAASLDLPTSWTDDDVPPETEPPDDYQVESEIPPAPSNEPAPKQGLLSRLIKRQPTDEAITNVADDAPPETTPPPDDVVSNEPDTIWRALDFRQALTLHHAAGAIYRAELRKNLSNAGIRFKKINNNWEIQGLGELKYDDVPLVKAFSQRSQRIEKERLAWETKNPDKKVTSKVLHLLGIRSRQTKVDVEVAMDTMQSYTLNRLLIDFGVDQDYLNGLFDNSTDKGPSSHRTMIDQAKEGDLSQLARHLFKNEEISSLSKKSHFSRQDMITAIAEIPSDGYDSSGIIRTANNLLSSDHCVALISSLEPGPSLSSVTVAQQVHPNLRYSTKEVLKEEAELISISQDVTSTGSLKSTPDTADLTEEQSNAVNHVVGRSNRIVLVAGAPGAGKTSLLAKASEAWKEAGWNVIGLAHQAQRASDLAAIPGVSWGRTIDSTLKRIAEEKLVIPDHSVIILDEAGATDRKRLLAVARLCRQTDSKLILVGDDRQAEPIEHGGTFSMLISLQGGTRLEGNRRQLYTHERNAINLARQGRGAEAIKWMQSEGRIMLCADEHSAVAAATEEVLSSLSQNVEGLAICHTNDQVRAVNATVHFALSNQGVLGKVAGEGKDGQEMREGERVAFGKNGTFYGRSVQNGTYGRIVNSTKDAIVVIPEKEEGKPPIHISRDWAKEHLSLGYAMTASKSQGVTVRGNAVVLGIETMDSSTALVAISRARLKTSIVSLCGRDELTGRITEDQQKVALNLLASKLTAEVVPNSATELLHDEAQAAKWARTLGSNGCLRLAALWRGWASGKPPAIDTSSIEHDEATLASPTATEEEKAEAQSRITFAEVVKERNITLQSAKGRSVAVDSAYAERQAEIAERAHELSLYGIDYIGPAYTVPQPTSKLSSDVPLNLPSVGTPSNMERPMEASTNVVGGAVLGLAKQKGIDLVKAAQIYAQEHDISKYDVSSLALSAQCARVAGLVATNSTRTRAYPRIDPQVKIAIDSGVAIERSDNRQSPDDSRSSRQSSNAPEAPGLQRSLRQSP
jgi:hypothetical protein